MNSELYQYHISAWTPTTARNYIPKMSEKKKAKVPDDHRVMEARKDLPKNVNSTNRIQTKTEARNLKLTKKCLKK